MMDHDPPPLDDPGSDVPSLLRDALAAARADRPAPADLASLSAGLQNAVSAPAAVAPSVLSGALIGGALGVIVSGAGLLWQARHEPPMATPAVPPVVAMATETPAVDTAPTSSAEPLRVPVRAAAPQPLRPAPAASSARPAPAPAETVQAAAPVESEIHLLQRAQEALGANPAHALALTAEHAARFPAGVLGQEREVVAIQALLRIGRADEARARGSRFVSAFPGSAHRRRIEALLGP